MEQYHDGIRRAEELQMISYRDEPKFMNDPYDFLGESGGDLKASNTRELSSDCLDFAEAMGAAWMLEEDPKQIRCLISGAGAGREIPGLRGAMPHNVTIDTLSLRPLNPFSQLFGGLSDIQRRIKSLQLAGRPEFAGRKHTDKISIEEVWKHRALLQGVMKETEAPSIAHQYVGNFPSAFRGKDAIPTKYQMIIEKLGVVFHSDDNRVLCDLYELLDEDGAMYVPDFGMLSKPEALHREIRRGDHMLASDTSAGSILVMRKRCPLLKILPDLQGNEFIKNIHSTTFREFKP